MANRSLRLMGLVAALSLAVGGGLSSASSKTDKKQAEIGKNAQESMSRLYKEQSSAKGLVNRSYGYAVFHSSQTALMISGGGGSGVAINRKSGKRVYMEMASGGVGVGIGFQVMDVVVVFETAGTFNDFVEKGWGADTSASAAAATEGVNKGASCTNGLAIFQMTDKGLIAQASLKGTKYWKDDKMNTAKKWTA